MTTDRRRDRLAFQADLDDSSLDALVDPQAKPAGRVLVKVIHVVEPPLGVALGADDPAVVGRDRDRLGTAVSHEALV